MSISILYPSLKPSNSYEAMQLHQRCSPPPLCKPTVNHGFGIDDHPDI